MMLPFTVFVQYLIREICLSFFMSVEVKKGYFIVSIEFFIFLM